MKFLPYSKENDEKITSDIIGCFASIKKLYLGEWHLEIETPFWFSSASKKEYFIAKSRFLHFLKFSDLAEITNSEWYERNSKLPWKEQYRFHHTEDYYHIAGGIGSNVATLREEYRRLYERNWLLKLRKRQKRRVKRQAKNSRKQPSLNKLYAAKASAAISTKIRSDIANKLTVEIYKKACELAEKSVPLHNIVATLANKHFNLSERQIRRHLLKSGFRKSLSCKSKKAKFVLQ